MSREHKWACVCLSVCGRERVRGDIEKDRALLISHSCSGPLLFSHYTRQWIAHHLPSLPLPPLALYTTVHPWVRSTTYDFIFSPVTGMALRYVNIGPRILMYFPLAIWLWIKSQLSHWGDCCIVLYQNSTTVGDCNIYQRYVFYSKNTVFQVHSSTHSQIHYHACITSQQSQTVAGLRWSTVVYFWSKAFHCLPSGAAA